jgi:hypothetical protein
MPARSPHRYGQLVTESLAKKNTGARPIIDVNDDIKLLGLWTMRINELAICVLDQIVGDGEPANVAPRSMPERRDARRRSHRSGHPRSASRDRLCANVTRELLTNLDVGNDTIAKDVSSIKQVSGSVGSTD